MAGFRAAIIGTPTGSHTPRTIAVSSVVAAETGCGGVPLAQNVDEHAECNTLENYYVAHGSLMIVAWALLLPCGVVVASRLKHLGPLWFKLHLILQISGLAVALAGFVIALSQFHHFVFDFAEEGERADCLAPIPIQVRDFSDKGIPHQGCLTGGTGPTSALW